MEEAQSWNSVLEGSWWTVGDICIFSVRKEDFSQKDSKSFLMFRTVTFYERVAATEGLEPSQTQHLLSRS